MEAECDKFSSGIGLNTFRNYICYVMSIHTMYHYLYQQVESDNFVHRDEFENHGEMNSA